MLRRPAAVAVLAALVASGCAAQPSRPAPASRVAAPSVNASPTDPGPLPPPEALAAVMNRLADPAVPGADKLPLLQSATAPDAVTLDQFSAALRDGGFNPAVFTVTDVRWADQTGDALATVTVSTADPTKPSAFSFPMEFRAGPGGWQLTRETAEMLLAFGNARATMTTGPTR